MSLRRPAKDQPETFEFNPSSLEAAKAIVSKYPEGKQAKCCYGFALHSSETK